MCYFLMSNTMADLRGDVYYSTVFLSSKRIVCAGKHLENGGYSFSCMGPMRTSCAAQVTPELAATL